MNLNKAMIIGNLTRDPESRSLPSGQNVCNFGVATNRVWKNAQTGEKQQAVEYHNIVAWGKLADTCSQYLKKGSKVYIEGRLQTGRVAGIGSRSRRGTRDRGKRDFSRVGPPGAPPQIPRRVRYPSVLHRLRAGHAAHCGSTNKRPAQTCCHWPSEWHEVHRRPS